MGRGRGGRRRRRSKKEAAKAKEEEKEETSNSIYIPEEIILCIFLLLPTESLLRFRFVSKRWYCLISPHVKQKVIFPYRKTCLYGYNYWCRDARCCALQGYRPFRSVDQTLSQIENIDLVVGNKTFITPCERNAHVCGSCNGLLLIKIATVLFLWDPSVCSHRGTLGYQRLSYYPCESKYDRNKMGIFSLIWPRTHLGLCYDSHSNDYKVLLALKEEEGWDRCTVMVGSFNSGTWKQVQLMFGVRFEMSCVVVNGYLHWLVYDEDRWCERILCFDPRIDQFVQLPLPEQRPDKSLRVLGMGVLDGCLSIAHWESNNLKRERCSTSDNTTFEVSVMKKYGVAESWTILFRFDRSDCRDRVVPLFFTDGRKRQVLMQIGDDIFAYDIDKDAYKPVAYTSSATEDVAIVYEERTTTLESRSKTSSMKTLGEVVDSMANQVVEVSPMPEQVWRAPPIRGQIREAPVNCTLPKQTWEVIGK